MIGECDTYVLPCAGAGQRLGLPFGKELTPIGDGQVLVDAALDLIAPYAHRSRLVVVVDDQREVTVRYLRRRCEDVGLPLALVYQSAHLIESTGAVLSAQAWFGTGNVVLLPDQVLSEPNPAVLAEALGHIHSGEGFCFLAARETDPARLAVDGALQVDDGRPARLVNFADKPGLARAEEFNAVWFGYAFAQHSAEQVLDVLHSATVDRCLPPAGLGPLLRSPVVEISPFYDLGTWPALRDYLARGDRR